MTKAFRRPARLAVLLLTGLLALGCGAPGAEKPSKPGEWKIVLNKDTDRHEFPVEIMNIFLVDPDYEDEYPEAFEITGNGIHLIGTFPRGLRIGYEAEYARLLSKPISVAIQSQDVADRGATDKYSFIKFPGASQRYVKSGTVTFTRISGKHEGKDGDLTLTGTIELKVDGPNGQTVETYTGTVSLHPVSWG